MLGGIYSEEKCQVCGASLVDNGRAMTCPKHKNVTSRRLYVRFGRTIQKRFSEYDRARRFLNGLRFKVDEGTFDERDYQAGNPLAFSNLTAKYLQVKEQTVSPGSFVHIKRDILAASDYFDGINVKSIQYGEIEDFLLSFRELSGKTKSNVKANLHAFFVWLTKRRVIRKDQMPEFPEIKYELGYRRTIDKETQDAILAEVKKISAKNPRVWLAIRFLCTYIQLRPGELRSILEEDVDLTKKVIIVKTHKTSKHIGAKPIPLLDEDVEFIESLPRGFPRMHFFRRDTGGGGRHAGSPFGKHILYDTWMKACRNLGINGVDLYGGTRHSTMQFLRGLGNSPEEIKRLSLHTTNKALNRYIEINPDELRAGYAQARDGSTMVAPKEKSRPSRIGSPG